MSFPTAWVLTRIFIKVSEDGNIQINGKGGSGAGTSGGKK